MYKNFRNFPKAHYKFSVKRAEDICIYILKIGLSLNL